MVPSGAMRRSRTRRAGESAYGLLLLGRHLAVALVALLILVAGVWSSWDTAKPAMFSEDRDRGTVTVAECDDDWCTGAFTPAEPSGRALAKVRVDEAVAVGRGDRLPVAIRPGTTEAIRTGAAGVLHAWVPFAGALLLSALILAGGLRLRRTGWVMGLVGALLLGSSFATLTM